MTDVVSIAPGDLLVLTYAPEDGSALTEEQFSRLKCELEAVKSATGCQAILLEGGLTLSVIRPTPSDQKGAGRA